MKLNTFFESASKNGWRHFSNIFVMLPALAWLNTGIRTESIFLPPRSSFEDTTQYFLSTIDDHGGEKFKLHVQSRQTIQNCQNSPADFQPYSIHRRAQICIGIFES
jgi:hypothetical protein